MSKASAPAKKAGAPVSWGVCLVALAFGGWKLWEHRRDAALEEQARVRGAQAYLIGVSNRDGTSRWHDGRAVAEWRDGSGNALRLDAVWNESLAVAGQLAVPDGALSVLDGVLDPATLPAPARSGGGYALVPDRIGRVAFSCESRSGAGGRGGLLQVQTVPAAPAPTPRLPSGGVDWRARFDSFLRDGADEIEATWTPDGGPPQMYLLRRAAPAVDPLPKPAAPAGPGSRAKRWDWMVTLFWIGAIGFAVGALREAYRRLTGGGPAASDRRRVWVEEVVRLLVLACRTTRAEQALREQERNLIAGVAATEAKRPDAPGGPIPLAIGEPEALVRGYQGDCPGVPELLAFLTAPENAELRTRLLKRVWQVAVCDGPAGEQEAAFARDFAAETGMPEPEFLSVSLRYHRPVPPEAELDAARALLELPRSATAEEVKRAYKRKAREYHPDAHAGAAENLRRLAAERFSKLGEAKELLLAALGRVPLVARDRAGTLVAAEDLPAEVCCFGCGAARPGALAAEAFLARCPRCLALLYHEPAFAADLAGDR